MNADEREFCKDKINLFFISCPAFIRVHLRLRNLLLI